MTKERLEQVMDLRNEIQRLEEEIEKIKRTKQQDKVSASLPEYPYTRASVTIQGYNYAPNIETRSRDAALVQKHCKLNGLLKEIEEWVDTIEDSKIRQIITYRFYEGLTWNDVAAKMGRRYSADGCRMAYKRFIKK